MSRNFTVEEEIIVVDKFVRTFHNSNYDAEFDDELIFDRSVIPPASCNKPDKWKQRNPIGLERVMEQLQSCVNSVSHGKSFMG